jgi:mevalonate pyrophosphate decarboxylase
MRPANESAKADANRTKNIAKAETLEVDAKQISNTERIQSGSGCQKKL